MLLRLNVSRYVFRFTRLRRCWALKYGVIAVIMFFLLVSSYVKESVPFRRSRRLQTFNRPPLSSKDGNGGDYIVLKDSNENSPVDYNDKEEEDFAAKNFMGEKEDYYDSEIVIHDPGEAIPEDDWFMEGIIEHRRNKHRNLQFGRDGINILRMSEFKSRKVKTYKLNVVFIVLGEEFARQAVAMMKSALMFSATEIRFKAFVNRRSAEIITEGMKSLTRDMYMRYYIMFYDLGASFSTHLKWKKADKIREFATFGPAGAMLKLLMPKLFQNFHKILIVDVDMIFFSDISLLWQQFRYFGQGQAMGMGDEGYTYLKPENRQRFYPPYGLNNGLMLVDVTATERVDFSTEILEYYEKEARFIISHQDQGLVNLYFADHPKELYHLDCNMIFHGDVDPCSYSDSTLRDKRSCVPAGETGAYILHGTSGRFRVNREISNSSSHYSWVVSPDTQLEYYQLYKAFDSMNVTKDFTWDYWKPVLNGFVEARQLYCPQSADYTNGLLQRLKASLTRLIGHEMY